MIQQVRLISFGVKNPVSEESFDDMKLKQGNKAAIAKTVAHGAKPSTPGQADPHPSAVKTAIAREMARGPVTGPGSEATKKYMELLAKAKREAGRGGHPNPQIQKVF